MKVPIVSTSDEIIGYKEREELDLDKDIVRSASLWITNNKGQVLLAQRKFTKRTDPGKWAEAVGGTVDDEDSYEETVYREAEEELGIKGVEFTLGPKQFVQGPPNSYFVQWYYVTLDWPIEKFIPQESEVEQVTWWSLDDLRNDIKNHPEQYIAALPGMIDLLSS
jgi:isopentenyl-diphosphate Delta-isomerase